MFLPPLAVGSPVSLRTPFYSFLSQSSAIFRKRVVSSISNRRLPFVILFAFKQISVLILIVPLYNVRFFNQNPSSGRLSFVDPAELSFLLNSLLIFRPSKGYFVVILIFVSFEFCSIRMRRLRRFSNRNTNKKHTRRIRKQRRFALDA